MMATRLLLLLVVTVATLSDFVDANGNDQETIVTVEVEEEPTTKRYHDVQNDQDLDQGQGQDLDQEEEEEEEEEEGDIISTAYNILEWEVLKKGAKKEREQNPDGSRKHTHFNYSPEEHELGRIFEFFHNDVLPVAATEVEEFIELDLSEEDLKPIESEKWTELARDLMADLSDEQAQILKHTLTIGTMGILGTKHNKHNNDDFQHTHHSKSSLHANDFIPPNASESRRRRHDETCGTRTDRRACLDESEGCLWMNTDLSSSAPHTAYQKEDFPEPLSEAGAIGIDALQQMGKKHTIRDYNHKTARPGEGADTIDHCVPNCPQVATKDKCQGMSQMCFWNAAVIADSGPTHAKQSSTVPKDTSGSCTFKPCNQFVATADCSAAPHCYPDEFYKPDTAGLDLDPTPVYTCRPKICTQTETEAECRDMEQLGLCFYDMEWRGDHGVPEPKCVPLARDGARGRSLAGLTNDEKWCNWNVHTCGMRPTYHSATSNFALVTGTLTGYGQRPNRDTGSQSLALAASSRIIQSFVSVFSSLSGVSGGQLTDAGAMLIDAVMKIISGITTVDPINFIEQLLPDGAKTLTDIGTNLLNGVVKFMFKLVTETVPKMLGLDKIFDILGKIQDFLSPIADIVSSIFNFIEGIISPIINTVKDVLAAITRRRRTVTARHPRAFANIPHKIKLSNQTVLEEIHNSTVVMYETYQLALIGVQQYMNQSNTENDTDTDSQHNTGYKVMTLLATVIDTAEDTYTRVHEAVEHEEHMLPSDHVNASAQEVALDETMLALRQDWKETHDHLCGAFRELSKQLKAKDHTGRCDLPRKTGPGRGRHRRFGFAAIFTFSPFDSTIASFIYRGVKEIIGTVAAKLAQALNPNTLIKLVATFVGGLLGIPGLENFNPVTDIIPFPSLIQSFNSFTEFATGMRRIRQTFKSESKRDAYVDFVASEWRMLDTEEVFGSSGARRDAPISQDVLFIQRHLMESPLEEMFVEESLEDARDSGVPDSTTTPRDIRFVRDGDNIVGLYTLASSTPVAAGYELAIIVCETIGEVIGLFHAKEEKKEAAAKLKKKNLASQKKDSDLKTPEIQPKMDRIELSVWAGANFLTLRVLLKALMLVFEFVQKWFEIALDYLAVHDGMIDAGESDTIQINSQQIMQGQSVLIAQMNELRAGNERNAEKYMALMEMHMDGQDNRLQQAKLMQEKQMTRIKNLALVSAKTILTPDNMLTRPEVLTDDPKKNKFPFATFHRSRTKFGDNPSQKPCVSTNCDPTTCYDDKEQQTFETLFSILNNNRFPFTERSLVEKEITELGMCDDAKDCVCDGGYTQPSTDTTADSVSNDLFKSKIHGSQSMMRGCGEVGEFEDIGSQSCGQQENERITQAGRDSYLETITSESLCLGLNFRWDPSKGCVAYTFSDYCSDPQGRTLWSTGECTADDTSTEVPSSATTLTRTTSIITSGLRGVKRLHRDRFKFKLRGEDDPEDTSDKGPLFVGDVKTGNTRIPGTSSRGYEATSDHTYSVTITTAATYTFSTCGGANFDTFLRLYNSDDDEVVNNDDDSCIVDSNTRGPAFNLFAPWDFASRSLKSTIQVALLPGVYTLLVEGYDTSSTSPNSGPDGVYEIAMTSSLPPSPPTTAAPTSATRTLRIVVSNCEFVASIRVFAKHASTSFADEGKRNFYMEQVFYCDDCSQGLIDDVVPDIPQYNRRTGGTAEVTLALGTYIIEVSGRGTRQRLEEGEDFDITVQTSDDAALDACQDNTMCNDYGITLDAITSADCNCDSPGELCRQEQWRVTCLDGFEPQVQGTVACSSFGTHPPCTLTAGVRAYFQTAMLTEQGPVVPGGFLRPVQDLLDTAAQEAANRFDSAADKAAILALNFSNIEIYPACFDTSDAQHTVLQVNVPLPRAWLPKYTSGSLPSEADRNAVMVDLKKILANLVQNVIGTIGKPKMTMAVQDVGTGLNHAIEGGLANYLMQSTAPLQFLKNVRDSEGKGYYTVALDVASVIVLKDDNINVDTFTFPFANAYPCDEANSKDSFVCPTSGGAATCPFVASLCASEFDCNSEPGHRTRADNNLCSSLECDLFVVVDNAAGGSANTPYVVSSTGAGAGMTITATTAGSFLDFNVNLDITAPGSLQYAVGQTLTLNALSGPTFRLNPHGRAPTIVATGLYALVTEVFGTAFTIGAGFAGTINGVAVDFNILTTRTAGATREVVTFKPTKSWFVLEEQHSDFFPTNSGGKAAIVIPSPTTGGTSIQVTVYSHEAFRRVDKLMCCEPYACDTVCNGNCVAQKYRTQDTGECTVQNFACPGGTVLSFMSKLLHPIYKCVPDASSRRRRSDRTPVVKKLKLDSPKKTPVKPKAKAKASKPSNSISVVVQPGMCQWENTSQWDRSQSTTATGQSWFRDWWKPCATCKDSRRVGTKRVGSLRVCGGLLDNHKKQAKCRAVSIGGDEHTSFEEDLALKWGCSVDAFRFTSSTSKSLSGLVTVHNATDTLEESIATTTTKSKVKVLKVDCDGCEYDQLCSSANVQTFVREQVEQLVLRTEFSNTTTPNLWKCIAEELHMAPFSKKITLGSNKVDYSFVNVAFATMATKGPV